MPWQIETSTNTCGPIPGLILTHTHVTPGDDLDDRLDLQYGWCPGGPGRNWQDRDGEGPPRPVFFSSRRRSGRSPCCLDRRGMGNGTTPRKSPVVSWKGIPKPLIPNTRKVIPYLWHQQVSSQSVWVWVKIKPPGIGPPLLVHGFQLPGLLPFWGYPILF